MLSNKFADATIRSRFALCPDRASCSVGVLSESTVEELG